MATSSVMCSSSSTTRTFGLVGRFGHGRVTVPRRPDGAPAPRHLQGRSQDGSPAASLAGRRIGGSNHGHPVTTPIARRRWSRSSVAPTGRRRPPAGHRRRHRQSPIFDVGRRRCHASIGRLGRLPGGAFPFDVGFTSPTSVVPTRPWAAAAARPRLGRRPRPAPRPPQGPRHGVLRLSVVGQRGPVRRRSWTATCRPTRRAAAAGHRSSSRSISALALGDAELATVPGCGREARRRASSRGLTTMP